MSEEIQPAQKSPLVALLLCWGSAVIVGLLLVVLTRVLGADASNTALAAVRNFALAIAIPVFTGAAAIAVAPRARLRQWGFIIPAVFTVPVLWGIYTVSQIPEYVSSAISVFSFALLIFGAAIGAFLTLVIRLNIRPRREDFHHLR